MFLSLIFVKVAAWGLQLYQKRDTSKIFNIFKNTPFKEHFWVTASINTAWNAKCWFINFLVHLACFSPTCWVITIIQIHFEKFALVSHWISCHLVFFFESMRWRKRDKKRGKLHCFTNGLGKTSIHYILKETHNSHFCATTKN